MFTRVLIISTRQGRQKNSLSSKERASVRMGSTDHDNSPHARPGLAPYSTTIPSIFSFGFGYESFSAFNCSTRICEMIRLRVVFESEGITYHDA